jgi:DNA mismatch endonuclease (patch repair protein)
MFKWPGTRTGFWHRKIEGNIERDRRVHAALAENGWRVLVIWECALRGPQRRPVAAVLDEIVRWFATDEAAGVIRGC